jgi:hypothetical protein
VGLTSELWRMTKKQRINVDYKHVAHFASGHGKTFPV